MKKVFLPILLIHFAAMVHAATYYFSSGSGDDARTSAQAQSSSTPWKTIAKLNAIMSTLKPGDAVMFKKGETFEGAITITVSGANGQPITFGAYGSGNRPVISGFTTLSGWSQVRTNVWEANCNVPSGSTNMVVMNDKQQAIGRYPNTNANNSGFLTVDSHSGGTQITSSGLANSPSNWNGGEVVIRKIRWVLDRNTITSHNGNTLNFIAGSGYNPSDKWGFFIQNHTNTLDQNGEWYYDNSRKKMQMYQTSNPGSATVKASVTPNLVTINYNSYITFNGLAFEGANSYAFWFTFSNNITINSCSINYSGGNAITANNANNFTFTNSFITNTNNNAIHLQYNCSNATIRNNRIRLTAVIPGMGQNDANTYQGIYLVGANNLVEYNQVDSTGYNGIHFEGENATVKNNLISTFDFIKDDGAGIYTGQGAYDNTVYNSRLVTGNIILNGVGARMGTDDTTYYATNGIYLDDNTNHVTVTNNTISQCGHAGIFNHNSRDITISNNTMYDNRQEQLLVVRDYIVTNPVRNVTITNNIMFSKTASQLANNVTSVENDIRQMGNFNSNYYCRPIDNNYVFFDAYYSGGQLYQQYNNLAGWQAKYGFDANSKGAPVTIPSYKINSLIGSNKYVNGYYNSNVYEVYPYSPVNDIATAWNPSKLDGGTLQVSANNYSMSNDFIVNMPVGKITAGKSYVMSFSLMGASSKKAIDVYLRKTGWPYTEFTPRSKVPITSNRTDYQFGFTATGSDDVSCILFEVDQPDAMMWIDNVVVQEANLTITNPDDYLIFQYNASTKNKSVKLPNGTTYYDATGKAYNGTVVLQPFTSVVLIKQNNNGYQTETDASRQAISIDGNLTNATASLTNATATDLTWQVNNQATNATYYEVERSTDATNFTTVGKAEVQTSTPNATYQFKDASPLAGKNYYRVKQYDEKGMNAISKVVMVNNIGFKLNPNPAHDVLHLMFDQPVTTADALGREIVIRSMTGATVKTIPMPATSNFNKVDINVSAFANGMYTLSFTSEGKVMSKPFLKQ